MNFGGARLIPMLNKSGVAYLDRQLLVLDLNPEELEILLSFECAAFAFFVFSYFE